jgi:hypothetical protein
LIQIADVEGRKLSFPVAVMKQVNSCDALCLQSINFLTDILNSKMLLKIQISKIRLNLNFKNPLKIIQQFKKRFSSYHTADPFIFFIDKRNSCRRKQFPKEKVLVKRTMKIVMKKSHQLPFLRTCSKDTEIAFFGFFITF